MNAIRHDNLVTGFKELYDVEPLLALDLVKQSVLQSGFNNSPTTIHNVIPTELLMTMFKNYWLTSLDFKEFDKQLVEQNSNKSQLIGRARYDKNTEEVIPFNTNYTYFTVKVPKNTTTLDKKNQEYRTALFHKVFDMQVNEYIYELNELEDAKYGTRNITFKDLGKSTQAKTRYKGDKAVIGKKVKPFSIKDQITECNG
jgi:hypothetical protein